jgi:small subunit ribosomal protein S6
VREYECMLILPAEADEAAVGTAVDRIEKVAAKHSGQVRGAERWGRRRLAYEIDRRTEGYYVVVTFAAEPSAQGELDRVLNLADEVVRYKTVVLPRRPRPERGQQPEPAPEQQLEASPAAVGGATPQGE